MTLHEIINKYMNNEIDEKTLFYKSNWPDWKALRIVLTSFWLIHDSNADHDRYTIIDRDYKLTGHEIMSNDWEIYE